MGFRSSIRPPSSPVANSFKEVLGIPPSPRVLTFSNLPTFTTVLQSQAHRPMRLRDLHFLYGDNARITPEEDLRLKPGAGPTNLDELRVLRSAVLLQLEDLRHPRVAAVEDEVPVAEPVRQVRRKPAPEYKAELGPARESKVQSLVSHSMFDLFDTDGGHGDRPRTVRRQLSVTRLEAEEPSAVPDDILGVRKPVDPAAVKAKWQRGIRQLRKAPQPPPLREVRGNPKKAPVPADTVELDAERQLYFGPRESGRKEPGGRFAIVASEIYRRRLKRTAPPFAATGGEAGRQSERSVGSASDGEGYGEPDGRRATDEVPKPAVVVSDVSPVRLPRSRPTTIDLRAVQRVARKDGTLRVTKEALESFSQLVSPLPPPRTPHPPTPASASLTPRIEEFLRQVEKWQTTPTAATYRSSDSGSGSESEACGGRGPASVRESPASELGGFAFSVASDADSASSGEYRTSSAGSASDDSDAASYTTSAAGSSDGRTSPPAFAIVGASEPVGRHPSRPPSYGAGESESDDDARSDAVRSDFSFPARSQDSFPTTVSADSASECSAASWRSEASRHARNRHDTLYHPHA